MSNFALFKQAVTAELTENQLITDYAKRYAYGTDASFYRLTPKLIIIVHSIGDVVRVNRLAYKYAVPLTYRAAGTSLSGQAITDSVLVLLSDTWTGYNVLDGGAKARFEPALIGAKANRILSPYGRKIGPDPASINSCKIGGIVANNASGMCCGVKHNSYHTIADLTLIFADGTILDTASPLSVDSFLSTQNSLVEQIKTLAQQVKADESLSSLIKSKYRLKNTTGYGINALVDFDCPIDIIKHLIVGSEGTLAFIADVTYHTLDDYKHKQTGFFIFNTITSAVSLVSELTELDVAACELLDKRSLVSVAHHSIMPDNIDALPDNAAALLIEIEAETANQLDSKVKQINRLITAWSSSIVDAIAFSSNTSLNQQLWNIRKGTFPAVGANRAIGTTVIIEDVSFPIDKMAVGIAQLHDLFNKYGYQEAIIFGHALVGNLHFVFTQAFDTEQEKARYKAFMAEVVTLVVKKLNGALKAEHGTGRNMAPFVKTEWGIRAYDVMLSIKQIFDPTNILNPDVIISTNENIHVENVKKLPKTHEIIDTCIECGFCEDVCPSHEFTFSPRQRIATYRHLKELEKSGENPQSLTELKTSFQFLGLDTCAATGMCGVQCPVGINTGEFVKSLRHEQFNASAAKKLISNVASRHFAATSSLLKTAVRVGEKAQHLWRSRNDNLPSQSSNMSNVLGKNAIELVRPPSIKPTLTKDLSTASVLYFPSCGARTFGNSGKTQLTNAISSVMAKAGYKLVIPNGFDSHCCGMPFASKGDSVNSYNKGENLERYIKKQLTENIVAVITDASSCAYHYSGHQFVTPIMEMSQFIAEHVLDKLVIDTTDEKVVLHVTCSSKRSGSENALVNIVNKLSSNVIIPADIACCGFAGDKGINLPALNHHALRHLNEQLPEKFIGLSNNRTCELGLTRETGTNFESYVILLDQLSRAKN